MRDRCEGIFFGRYNMLEYRDLALWDEYTECSASLYPLVLQQF